MPDIRDVLKGLSPEDRALYSEARTVMRRAYLSAHAKILPIEKYEEDDDAFLDLIDVKLALLFDRAGVFDGLAGNLDTDKVKEVEKDIEASAATKLMQQPLKNGNGDNGWTTKVAS